MQSQRALDDANDETKRAELSKKVAALQCQVEGMNRRRWTTEAAILDEHLMSMALQFAVKQAHMLIGTLRKP